MTKATLLIFGASRGTGYCVIKQAINKGLSCIAVVRDIEKAKELEQLGVKVIVGDANDNHIVEQACIKAGKESTIISTLGGAQANYHAQLKIIDQAENQGLKKMVLVTSLGCGDSWDTLSEKAKMAFGLSVREKTLAEAWLQTSSLDYCILRPGGLMNGEPTHNAKCYSQQEVHGYVMRQDLAALILEKVQSSTLNRTIFSVVDPNLIAHRQY